MAILSMALYGSRAREDHTATSDTDLFAITSDDAYEMLFHGNTNIACYPHDLAMSRAKGGDLFFLHIVREGIVMYDPDASFEKLQSAFRLRESYNDDIRKAAELGLALLLNIKSFKNYFFINKRLAWCLRTMLIAISAERREPVFAAKDLGLLFEDKDIELLLAAKNEPGYLSDHYKLFKSKFLIYGGRAGNEFPQSLYAQLECFSKKGNSMAVKTMLSLIKGLEDEDYT